MDVWWLLTFGLVLKFTYALVAVGASLVYLLLPRRVLTQTDAADYEIYVLIPLLREQRCLRDLFCRFTSFLQEFPNLRLMFVTTHREEVEGPRDGIPTTAELLQSMITDNASCQDSIFHVHYPGVNRTLAEQLNFAVEAMHSFARQPARRRYVLTYNADSVVDVDTLATMMRLAAEDIPVAQQSSLFLWNVPSLLEKGQYYLAAHGLRQSRWTLHYEIPRFLFCRRFLPLLPSVLEHHSLVHTVGHGLLIRLDVLEEAGGWPAPVIGGEDLGLGFVLKVVGYRVLPVRILENAETPDTLRQLVNQKAVWFLGTLGYPSYWRFVPAQRRAGSKVRLTSLTIQGVFDMANWLLAAPLIIAYLIVGCTSGHALATIVLYLAYVFVPLSGVFWLWACLPIKTFPRARVAQLLPSLALYPLVPILHSLHAMYGAFYAMKLLASSSSVRPKTER